MVQSPDYPRLLAGLTELVDAPHAGDAGLSTLRRLLASGQEAIGADGMSFTAYGPTGGRVRLATGAAESLLGSPVPGGPRIRESSVADLPAELAAELRGRGLHRVLAAHAERDGLGIAGIEAYFADPHAHADAGRRAVLDFLAAAALRLSSRDRAGARRRERDQDLFLAVTSHQLRTPVTAIKGFADTLGEHWDSLDERARREAVHVIGRRTGELARLVDRLLAAVSDGAAHRAPVCAPFDLVEALRAAVEQLPSDLRAGLRVRLPAALPKAYGDGSSVVTVLTELATNAHRYSPRPAEVTLTADADGRTVFFQVADRGVGIRPEHVERAFERFWRAEAGEQGGDDGIGLGLYLLRRMLDRQNGWVSLRPRELGGTVAEVRLPRADVASGEA